MAAIITLTPTLLFPQGPINLSQISKAYITMPLPLIQYMDLLVSSFPPSDSSTDIKTKAAPAVKVLREKLAEALSSGSSESQGWLVSHDLAAFVHRARDGAQTPVAVGFVMLRGGGPGGVEGRGEMLSVRVNCGDKPSGGRLDCEVVLWY